MKKAPNHPSPKSAKGKAASRRTSLSHEATPVTKSAKLPELAALEEVVDAAQPEVAWTEAQSERKKPKAKAQPAASPAEERKLNRSDTKESQTAKAERSPTKGNCVTQEMVDTQQEKIDQLLSDKASNVAELQRMDEEVVSLQSQLTRCEEGLQELADNNAHRQEAASASADQACNEARLNVDAANDRAQKAEDQVRELQRSLWKAKARIHKAECLLEQLEDEDLLELLDPKDLEDDDSEASRSDMAENPQEAQACLDQLIGDLGVNKEPEAPRPTVDPELILQVQEAEEKALQAEERAKAAHAATVELEAKVKTANTVAEEAEHRHQLLMDSALNLPDAIEEEDFSDVASGDSFSSAGRRGSTKSEWHQTWEDQSEEEEEAVPIKKTKSIPAKLGRLLSGGFL